MKVRPQPASARARLAPLPYGPRTGRPWLRLAALIVALPLGGCHFDDEVEGYPEAGPVDAAPDGPPGCAEGAIEACEPAEGCTGERTCTAGAFGPCVAPPERCDGADNDCDGTADEGFDGLGEPCSAGEGVCAADGVTVCDAAGEAVVCDATAGAPGEEACNGLDDDCDGTADEGFGGGVPCETGESGVCAAGTTICEAGGTICVRDAEPSAELCDGLDNDCDGATDEGEDGAALTRECYDGPADTVGNGPCLGGTQTCEGGVFGACVGQVLPGVEICDGVDNDCDAEPDDVDGGCACLPGEVRDCYSGPDGTAGVGACRMGTQTCLDDGSTFGPCDGEVLPAAEVCATRDADLDCDGDTDDVPGTGEACSVGVGPCAVDGLTACGADDGIACDAAPGAPGVEICDGIDNDCDGVVDNVEGLGEACRVGVGACASDGVRICDLDAGALACDAAPGAPVDEICDGVDNDCDGDVDDVAGLGDPCETGVGACITVGARVCDLGAGALVCDAVAGQPAPETCDGIDNDCDGDVDDVEGLGEACQVGVGACVTDGVRVCDLDAGALACDASPGAPAAETCDGIDNDCDGQVDDVAGLGDACEVGVGACITVGARICDLGAGALVCDATAGAGQVEICDGIDNDCDGIVDDVEGIGDACSAGVGACQRDGARVCDVAARQLVCDARPAPPGDEICDGIDNDCDGQIDDVAGLGEPCSAGTGACQRGGNRLCDVGARQLVCNAQPGQPAAETCDGVDNDCDGQVDDVAGVGDPCSAGTGACLRDGARVCDAGTGQVICGARPGQPANEICDGIDNDCNGVIDNVAGLGGACTAGAGICQRNGTRICDLGARQLVCDAQPGPGQAETCDNRDEDCDGRTDEGVTQACYPGPGGTQNVGVCRGGTQACNGGAFGACQGAVTPTDEFCSGQDNNCNGEIDDIYVDFDASDYPAALQCFDFALADLDRNGRPDVACVLNGDDGRVAYWLDAGVGQFAAVRYTAALPSRAYKLEFADLDRDGDNDLVAVGGFMRPHVIINDNGNLRAPVEAFFYNAASPVSSGLALADMTGDGIVDIVSTIGSQGQAMYPLAIARGNGDGTFAAPVEHGTGPAAYDLAVGDVDQDGDLDVLAMSGLTAGVYRANGANLANYAELVAFRNYPQKMMYTDFTGDGRSDLLIGTEAEWLLGRAQGAGFAFTRTVDRGTLMAVTAGQFDCDPLPEAVMTRSNPGSPIVIVGEPQTQSRIYERFSAHGWGLEAAELSGDGLDDLILPRAAGGFHLLRQRP